MLLSPFANPIPMIAPTTACELETGTNGIVGRLSDNNRFCNETEPNRNSTKELDSTTINAVAGDIL